MAKIVLLGLGGTGSAVVDLVSGRLNSMGSEVNTENICCAVLDSDKGDMEFLETRQSGAPILPTTKSLTVEQYKREYPESTEWLPISERLDGRAMTKGCGQMRYLSRLALMDAATDADGALKTLAKYINPLISTSSDIRVMIVSSLAGGTGSGMFIQVALWLRKLFEQRHCPVLIKGIFLLPDIFINTIDNIAENDDEKRSLYANAYAAIQELNTITKIRTTKAKLRLPVKLDLFFDSTRINKALPPVYDFAFFMDYVSSASRTLSSLEEYEQLVADLVYMQLFAPMSDTLESSEDNRFKDIATSPEPVYGACGTAKAVYPFEDVLTYCALRAAGDSLSNGWMRIDDEIRAMLEKQSEEEARGATIRAYINPRREFVRRFEFLTGQDPDLVESLFGQIKMDVYNETAVHSADEVTFIPSEKVSDFLKSVDALIREKVDTGDPGYSKGLCLPDRFETNGGGTRESMKVLVDSKSKAIENYLNTVDGCAEELAKELLDTIIPTNMGDVRPENIRSIFELLTKIDKKGELAYVHPLAARYMLCKALDRIDALRRSIQLKNRRENAERGYSVHKCAGDERPVPKTKFDVKGTLRIEDVTPREYLELGAGWSSEASFIKNFRKLYREHNEHQVGLCRVYAREVIKLKLLAQLAKRIESLLSILESFFDNLPDVFKSITSETEAVANAHSESAKNIRYVYASREEKEEVYLSLAREGGKTGEEDLSKIVSESLYGVFCYTEEPRAKNNERFEGNDIAYLFFTEICRAYARSIIATKRNKVDMDIYTALCREVDHNSRGTEGKVEKPTYKLGSLLDDGKKPAKTAAASGTKYQAAMAKLKAELEDKASPFLDIAVTGATPSITFWGYNPIVVEKYGASALGALLGTVVAKESNTAYSPYELNCYSSIYGMRAGEIDKFNEDNPRGLDNNYYVHYSKVIRSFATGVVDEGILTPHLDRTWHQFLPCISEGKQNEIDKLFFRRFLLALAYGKITLDKNGKYVIERTVREGGITSHPKEQLKSNDRPIGKTDVRTLIETLKLDAKFIVDTEELESRFASDCSIGTYDRTEFLRGKLVPIGGKTVRRGGLASKNDLNAVTILVRYLASRACSETELELFTSTMEELFRQLALVNYSEDETDKLTDRSYALCYEVYKNSALESKMTVERFTRWLPVSGDAEESDE